MKQSANQQLAKTIEGRVKHWKKKPPARSEVINAIKGWQQMAENNSLEAFADRLFEIGENIYAATKLDWHAQFISDVDALVLKMKDADAIPGELSPEAKRNRRGLRF